MPRRFNEKSLHAIDPKGRLLLPQDIRQALKIKKGDVLYLVPNLADPPYLEVRTASQWAEYQQGLRREASGEQKKDSFRYAMLIRDKAIVDGQGRFMIPNQIRENCKLNGTVAVVNMDIYVEVWAEDQLEKKYTDMVRAFKATNDRMF